MSIVELQNHESVPPIASMNDERWGANYEEYDGDDLGPTMSLAEIRRVALQHDGYETPALNDKLYLHFKGYRRIENLDKYVGLKALWLDNNGFEALENLSHLSSLRCLYLQRNLLTRIENLAGLDSLVQLDISENRLLRLDGLACLPNLATLNVSKNILADAASIEELTECTALTNVDLSHNELRGEAVLETITRISKLVALNVTGNPAAKETSQFRKKCIVALKDLRYLDRPVFEHERATAEAWARGGREEELATKKRLEQETRQKDRKSVEDFRQWQSEVRKKNEEERRNPTPEQAARKEMLQAQKEERENRASEEAARESHVYTLSPPSEDDVVEKYMPTLADCDDGCENESDKTDPSSLGVEGEKDGDVSLVEDATNPSGQEPTPTAETAAAKQPTDAVENKIHSLSDVNSEDNAGICSAPAAETVPKPTAVVENEEALLPPKPTTVIENEKVATSPSETSEEEQPLDANNRQLVEESLAIYRKTKHNAEEPVELEQTKDAKNADDKQAKDKILEELPIRWTPTMDLSLYGHVQACAYDFMEVARRVSEEYKTALTAEDCRVRYCLVDSQKESRQEEDGNLSTLDLPQAPARQDRKSYDDLELEVCSAKCSYLHPPIDLPSCDIDGDFGADGSEEACSMPEIFHREVAPVLT